MLFAFTACSDSAPLEPEATVEVQLPQPTELNQTLKTLAQATSRLVEEPEFRTWLKAEALKQFDGDYDVLWQHHLDHRFSDGQTLRAKLANALAEQYDSPKAAAEQLDRWMEAYPVLQFAVPVHIEDWEAEMVAIPVTYAAEDAEDSTVHSIEVFSQENIAAKLSLSDAPESPVIVVGLSERCGDNGEILDFLSEKSSSILPASKSFDEGQVIELWQVNVPDLNKWESWLYGKPEFWCSARGAYIPSQGSNAIAFTLQEFTFTGKRNKFEPSDWFQLNEPLWYAWNDDLPGRIISLNFRETDKGVPINVSVKLFSAEIKPDWAPDWLSFNVGPSLSIDEISDSFKNMGTTSCDRNQYCWTDYNTGSQSQGSGMRFYLNCE